ncbi:GNAT family N-acetyltransferase [Inhella sp.]|uniref:GNAT family N-acetyltransferase n=1 Tax=Inhella sp. TaxID=1921806 RepID=UPI0035B17605
MIARLSELGRSAWRWRGAEPAPLSQCFLRPYREADFHAFAALNADPAVRRFVGGPLSDAQARECFAALRGGRLQAWAVERAGRYAGHAWLLAPDAQGECELGVLIATEHWRQGLGLAVVRALRQQAQGLGLRVRASVDLGNAACIALLERAGLCLRERVVDEEGPYCVYAELMG